ncbi:glycosyltransferase [Mesorhizobium sp. YC-39]|uniref:glycosyltransferase family 2 protein n=1 Tax=unclassified Mesorhizobium TaxID=325217 RepID=UPI0021E97FD1|nr:MULTISPECIES: glycosyltransferase family 2 protein [unclassified Mesorhizobium]MCV3205348.1 glycosyltransferase [Mesorhizobium sp. YC-2]MCV3228253.1 glycosyltransferase [Mesorhizobium sp. YC-39]
MIKDNATAGCVVPMFNAEQAIGTTLASIHRQIYQLLDTVVVDDGSTDGSESIVTAYAKKDQRIRLLRQQNGGVAAARLCFGTLVPPSNQARVRRRGA